MTEHTRKPQGLGLLAGFALFLAVVGAFFGYLRYIYTPHKPPRITHERARRLTDGRTADQYPRWSPDGRWIVFQRSYTFITEHAELVPFPTDLILVDVQSGQERRLTYADNLNVYQHPTFSPSGEEIAFVLSDYRNDTSALFTIRSDGTNLKKVIDCPEGCFFPDWSPDGKTIILVLGQFDSNRGVLGLLDLGHPAEITPIPHGGSEPVETPRWSPDGLEALFWNHLMETNTIALPDGHIERLNFPMGAEPDWSPSGDLIAFSARLYPHGTRNRGGETIYITNRDADWFELLLPKRLEETLVQPDWSPDGKSIAAAYKDRSHVSHIYVFDVAERMQLP